MVKSYLLPDLRDSMDDNPMTKRYHPVFRRQLTPHVEMDFSNTYHSETYAPWFSDPSKADRGKNVKGQRVKAPWLSVNSPWGYQTG